MEDIDQRFRLEAFEYLHRLTRGRADEIVRWQDLLAFRFGERKAPLIGARGIWKPAQIHLPISVATAPLKGTRPRPYEDEIRDDDTILYRYQGTDPDAPDNAGLRRLMWERRPLIYFHGIEKGLYLAAWPVYVVGDDKPGLTFTIDLGPRTGVGSQVADRAEAGYGEKRYVFVPAKRRVHQARFRLRVMRAYQRRCSICRLGHQELLDAAHIIPDAESGGEATISNGLSLCKIHHAAFDGNIIGIDPDLVVHVREDILEEKDGPMLQHGIKETHGMRLRVVPRRKEDRPSQARLAERFRRFKQA